jgi:hypothetical protein
MNDPVPAKERGRMKRRVRRRVLEGIDNIYLVNNVGQRLQDSLLIGALHELYRDA